MTENAPPFPEMEPYQERFVNDAAGEMPVIEDLPAAELGARIAEVVAVHQVVPILKSEDHESCIPRSGDAEIMESPFQIPLVGEEKGLHPMEVSL